MSAPLARREQVAREVSAALDESRLRLAESELDRMLRAADGRGARLFEEEVILRERPGSESLRVRGLKALGISTLSVHRVLGLGGWQAQVLGGEAAERAGALFNLGIVLFDAALDRGTPTSRRQVLRFDMARLDRTGVTPEIAFLGIVAQRFFEVAGERVARGSLERLLAAELASAGAAPSLRAMRRKSVEPFVLMAALGGRDPAMARVFGRAGRARAAGRSRPATVSPQRWARGSGCRDRSRSLPQRSPQRATDLATRGLRRSGRLSKSSRATYDSASQ